MPFVLKRNLIVEIDLKGETIELDITDLTATQRLDYFHEIAVLQEKLKEDGGSAHASELYRVQIGLLASQVTAIRGVQDGEGNTITLPEKEADRKSLFDALGIEFINLAIEAYASKMNEGAEGNGVSK